MSAFFIVVFTEILMSIIKELQIISNDYTMSLDNKLESLLAIGTKFLGL